MINIRLNTVERGYQAKVYKFNNRKDDTVFSKDNALSEVLKAIKLDAAFFYNAEFTAPWSVREPCSEAVAPHFAQGGGRVIIYHCACWWRIRKITRRAFDKIRDSVSCG